MPSCRLCVKTRKLGLTPMGRSRSSSNARPQPTGHPGNPRPVGGKDVSTTVSTSPISVRSQLVWLERPVSFASRYSGIRKLASAAALLQ